MKQSLKYSLVIALTMMSLIFSALGVQPVQAANNLGPSQDITTGLLAWYKFDGNASDSSGNGYNGTEANITYAAGELGQAAQFNGSSSKIDVPSLAGILPGGGGARSVAFWVNQTMAVTGDVTSWGTSSNNQRFSVALLSNGNILAVGYFNDVNSGQSVPASTWTHVVVTYEGGATRFYVNGALVQTMTPTSPYSTSSAQMLRIGVNVQGADSEWFGGELDDLRIYNRRLSDADVAELYNYNPCSITVTSNADSGVGSLRQAIADVCDGGTITFDSSLNGQAITLASTLTINKTITITGNGASNTIIQPGSGNIRHFIVSAGNLTLDGMTLQNGNCMGGCAVSTSYGGAMYVTNASSTVTILNSYFANNHTNSNGGAITTGGPLVVRNSTFANNAADYPGAGGAIWGNNVDISNSTFTGNSGGYLAGTLGASTGSIINSTIANNGGAVAVLIGNPGSFILSNNIIANNSGGDCSASSAFNVAKNNLIANSGSACGLSNGVNGNIIGSDPSLDVLADNGGATQTMALLNGSLALGAGDAATCTAAPVSNLDQRGETRPQGNAKCDIGAFESSLVLVVTIHVNDAGDAVANDGVCTLREAITSANSDTASGASAGECAAGSGDDTIVFDDDYTITIGSTLPTVTSNITITGNGASNTIIQPGSGNIRHFIVSAGNLTLDGVTLQNGNCMGGCAVSTSYGGAVYVTNNGSTVTILNSYFANNHTNSNGGAITTGGPLVVRNSTFANNVADYPGAGGAIWGNSVDISNSTFTGNSGGYLAGTVGASTGSIINSTIANNDGAVAVLIGNPGSFTLSNTVIANNSGGDCSASSAFNVAKNNLIKNSGSACGLSNGVDGNIIGSDPSLDVLADNGGPTQTMALLNGSLALGAGDAATCTAAPVNNLDQRGETRPQGEVNCDMGAYETSGAVSDTTAPTVDTFTAVSLSNSLDVTISGFTASDDTAVTGYMITESSTQPASSDSGWSASVPTTYTVASDGSYTLYPWAMDAAGNISSAFVSPVSVTVDTTAPTTYFVQTPLKYTTSRSTTFEFSGTDSITAPENLTFKCGYLITDWWDCTSPFTSPNLPVGKHQFYVYAIDEAGNSDPVQAIYYWTIQGERAKNGGLNTYTGTSKVPASWTAAGFAATDGKDTASKKEGTASVKITGQPGKTKTLTQTLTLSGANGDRLDLSFWVKGASIPAAGLCQAQVLVYNGATLKQTQTVSCKTGTYAAFQQKTLSFNATSKFTKVVIKFTYNKASGSVWFDKVSLLK